MSRSSSFSFRAAAIIFVCAFLFLGLAAPEGCKKKSEEEGTEEAPITVLALAPQSRAMEEVIEVHGNIEPVQRADLVSEVSGAVEALYADVGDEVEAGMLLAKIDDEEYRLSLQQSQAAYRLARSEYLSAKELYDEGMKSKSELDKLRRSYDDARSSLSLSQLRVKNTEIKSPFEGVVIKRNVELYRQVNAMEVIMTVADLDNLKIPITVTEAEVAKISLGQEVRIRIDAIHADLDPSEFPLEGKVSKIQPMVDTQTGTVEVEVSIPNPGMNVRPGMFARLKVVTSVKPEALVIPRRALIAGNENQVWVAAGENARLVNIKTGLVDEKWIETLEGVKDTDLVIVEGQAALTPSSKIVIKRGDLEKGAGNGS